MLWWVGTGLIVVWLVLQLFAPRGWIPIVLLAGVCVLIVQIAAYRKTKIHGSHR
jgi:predicted benzoate:H+ symporter BenE